MAIFVHYETIDSNGEVEREFPTLRDAQYHIDSMSDLPVWHTFSDAQGEIDPSHYCHVHAVTTGEGDICAQCEAAYSAKVKIIDQHIKRHGASLHVCTKADRKFTVPVYSFTDAKKVYYTLHGDHIKTVKLHYFDGANSLFHSFQ